MPSPFPEDFNKSTTTSPDFANLDLTRPERMIGKVSVIVLSWLAVGKVSCCPPEARVRSTLQGLRLLQHTA